MEDLQAKLTAYSQQLEQVRYLYFFLVIGYLCVDIWLLYRKSITIVNFAVVGNCRLCSCVFGCLYSPVSSRMANCRVFE